MPGQWDVTNLLWAVLPKCGSNGNMSSNLAAGNFPVYSPNQAAKIFTLTNAAGNDGYRAVDGSILNESGSFSLDSNESIAWTNTIKRAFEVGFEYKSDGANTQNIFGEITAATIYAMFRIFGDRTFEIIFRNGATIDRAISSDTVLNGDNHVVAYKDGATLRLWLNGSEVAYSTQNLYEIGNLDLAGNYTVFENGDGTKPFQQNLGSGGKIYRLSCYSDITETEIINNYNIGHDYGGLVGTDNGDDTMFVSVPTSPRSNASRMSIGNSIST